ncbi:UNVERIFIED_CONTAM: hypothetical protein Sindi_2279700 [Sesamum indicum]
MRSAIRASCRDGDEASCDDPNKSCWESVGARCESPRHAASPSERAKNPEDGHSRLTELEEKVSSLEFEITVLKSELDECWQVIQEMAGAFGGYGSLEQMSIQIGLLQHTVSNAPVIAHDPGAGLWIPEPKAYSGARDAKEVENFLFDMEQYFFMADVQDEARKVSSATMHLTGDAKLWWRTKYAEIQAHQVCGDTGPSSGGDPRAILL